MLYTNLSSILFGVQNWYQERQKASLSKRLKIGKVRGKECGKVLRSGLSGGREQGGKFF